MFEICMRIDIRVNSDIHGHFYDYAAYWVKYNLKHTYAV